MRVFCSSFSSSESLLEFLFSRTRICVRTGIISSSFFSEDIICSHKLIVFSKLDEFKIICSLLKHSVNLFVVSWFKNELRNLSEKKLQFLLQKGDKSTQDEVEQKIAGIAKNIFSSNEERKKYDNYLSGSRYFKLNELIRDGINSNNNTINANLYNIIVNIAEKEYKLSKKDAISYVNNFAKIYKIKLDENIIPDIILHQVKDNTVINNDEEPNKFEQESKSEIDKINEEKPTDNFEEIDKDEQEDEFADFDENVPPPIPQPVPRPIPKPQNQPENTDKIKPTIDFNSIIKTLE